MNFRFADVGFPVLHYPFGRTPCPFRPSLKYSPATLKIFHHLSKKFVMLAKNVWTMRNAPVPLPALSALPRPGTAERHAKCQSFLFVSSEIFRKSCNEFFCKVDGTAESKTRLP